MKQTVKLNYLRMAPRKVRAVAGLLRGVPVNEAEARLLFERRRPAKPLLKLLRSAITSAKTNQKANPDKLVIETITVDGGPMLKRSLPRARGSASMIQKKMSHITLVLVEREAVAARFSIVVKKKAKKPEGEGRARKPKKTAAVPSADQPIEKKKDPGFFKRVFRRKSV